MSKFLSVSRGTFYSIVKGRISKSLDFISEWILEKGYWNDNGIWKDSSIWKD